MVRAGLGANWKCLFANDIDPSKAAIYCENWGGNEFILKDVAHLTTKELPARADLAWASFPCQDLSLAGNGAGLNGSRSGTFWPFWRLIEQLAAEERAPRIVALENVTGALSSHGGKDFVSIIQALVRAGYATGAMVIDAALFLPQSRPRLFIIGVQGDVPSELHQIGPDPLWHPTRLIRAYDKLPEESLELWRWWSLPEPPPRKKNIIDIIEHSPNEVSWFSKEETCKLLDMMSPANRSKVEKAQQMRKLMVGTVFRRTRRLANGKKTQRAEVRFDGIAGCLRTPGGGSSRQILLFVEGDNIRARLLSPRETARLMGLPDNYILPENRNLAYHLTGDGVAVPVVEWLSKHLFLPLLNHTQNENAGKAA